MSLGAGLSAETRQRLLRLAGLDEEPPGLESALGVALRLLAAGLLGFGLLMWVAANWGAWSRSTHFLLLQGAWALALLVCWRLPRARLAAGLLAFLLQGGLLAYFGQTYQTGADPWQLFALWALLTLPLAAQLRHDLLWTPWTLVLALAVTLWTHSYSGHRWAADAQSLTVQLLASAVLALSLGLLQALAAPWGARALAIWSALLLSGWGLVALFGQTVGAQYLLAGALMGLGLATQWRRGDLVLLSAFALALDVWAVAGLARLLLKDAPREPIGALLLLGLCAAGLLAASVSLLMRRARAGIRA